MIAVTGGTGFLGRRIVAELLARGEPVRLLTRRRPPPPTESPANHLEYAVCDLPGHVDDDSLRGIHTLIHAAAYVPRSMSDPAEADPCWQVNGLGTLNLLRAAQRAGVSTIVQVSTGNAYRTDREVASEPDPLYPSGRAPFYLASKLTGEVFADSPGVTGDCRVVIVRPSSIYGPLMPNGGLMGTLVARAKAGETLHVDLGGAYRADFVYVDDVAEAVVSCVASDARGPYNLGSGVATTSLELAMALLRLTGGDEGTRLRITGTPPTTGHAGFPALDISRARAALGFHPRDLDAGLAAMLAGAAS